MMLVVLDTNVLVSGLWSKNGSAAKVLSLVLNGSITPCYDQRILAEYIDVLKRPNFNFTEWDVNGILSQIKHLGWSIVAEPLAVPFADMDDLKFYEVAKQCQATLITGNLRHFPAELLITSVSGFLNSYIS